MSTVTTDLTATPPLPHPEESLFTGKAEWHLPVIADRYDTKKKAGDSDGYNTSDEIEV
jgi:hypothetical protein